MALLRLFIAIDAPAPVRRAIAAASPELSSLEGVRWVRPETLHLTLKFLGDTPAERVGEITVAAREALAGIGEGELGFAGLGVFPNARRPSVVWAKVSEGGEWLVDLAARVDAAMAGLGFPAETRAFRPHLTLGRLRPGARLPSGQLEAVLDAFAEHPFGGGSTRSATLYASTLSRAGAKHDPLATLPFVD